MADVAAHDQSVGWASAAAVSPDWLPDRHQHARPPSLGDGPRPDASRNRLDALGQRLGQDKLDAQQARSEAEDLDMLQAISDFQNRQSGYDAALKTYSIVQRMSLFDHIR